MNIEIPKIESEPSEEQKIELLREKIGSRRKELGVIAWYEKVIDFVNDLKSQGYSDEELKTTRLYHLIISSTPNKTTQFDIGDGLIESFIND